MAPTDKLYLNIYSCIHRLLLVDCLKKVQGDSSRVYPQLARIATQINVTLHPC